MNISVNLESVFAGMPPEEGLPVLASLGYSYCERWAFDAAQDEGFARALGREGLGLVAFCPDFFTLNDPAARETYARAVEAACGRASALGCGKLITQVGDDTGAPRAAQREAIVDGLRAVLPLLERGGMTLLVEPLNNVRDHPGTFLTGAAEGLEIVRAVDSPRVRLLYDVYHQLHMGADVLAEISAGLAWIGHFHLAGFPARDARLFGGGFDHRPLLSMLAASGTDAFVGLEFFPRGADAARRTLADMADWLDA